MSGPRLSVETLRPAMAVADSAIRRIGSGPVTWNYENGLLLLSLLALGAGTGERRYFTFVKNTVDTLVSPDGTIAGYRLEEYNVDQINAGKVLLALYAESGADRYRAALRLLRSQFDTHPRTASGLFWHKRIYPNQVWLDGLYMWGPFLARYAREFAEPGLLAEVTRALLRVEKETRDERTGLLRHAWDESRAQPWSDPATGRSPHVWGRAVGWYAMALVDTVDWLPPGHPAREEIGAVAGRLAEAVLGVQDPGTGLWYQVMDQPRRAGNYLETSASCMLVYFLARGLRGGLLSGASALAAARRGYDGIVRRRLRTGPDGETHLDGICRVAGLGGKPYRDGSFEYYIGEPVGPDDPKGVGPFILAGLEMAALT